MQDLAFQNSADIVWITVCAALVFIMQAGFAFVESGSVRVKNTVNVLMKNYIDLCFGSIFFWAIGFGLMYGANESGWFGTDLFFPGDLSNKDFALLLFNILFASAAATIMSGALAERIRYSSYVISAIVVSAFIYAIFGSWVWGSLDGNSSGWLKAMGYIDFAGSTVVHAIGGWAALAGIIVLGPRLGRFGVNGEVREIEGHSLPLVALGAFLLWLGWFGFNAGSTLQVDASVGKIALNTHLSGVSGAIGAILLLLVARKPLTFNMIVNGSLGGLVASCAGVHLYAPGSAVLIGFVAGIVVVLGCKLLEKLRLDDPIGAVPVHGLCGAWGAIAVGLFAADNMFNAEQIVIQMIGVFASFVWAFTLALVTFFLIKKMMGLRSSTLDEQRGLDYTEHSNRGYPEFQGGKKLYDETK